MAVKLDTYIALEGSLASRVAGAWGRVSETTLPHIYTKLQRNDVLGATRMVDELDFSPIIRECRDYVRYVSYAAIMFGASRLNDKLDQAKVIGSGKLAPMVSRVTASYAAALTGSVAEQVKAKLLGIISEHDLNNPATNFAPSDGNVIFKADVQTVLRPYVEFRNPVNDEAQRMIQMISGLHTSRLAAFGYTEEASLLGVTHYSINEQLDNRICPVCRVMHGKTFAVADARSLLDRVLYTDDPNELKTLQPWPAQDKASVEELRGMSNEEIIAMGWHTPPYHPYCRGQLVKAGEVPLIEDTPSWQAAFPEVVGGDYSPQRIDEESFNTLGVDVTPEEAQAWATETNGVPPEEYLSQITGMSPQEMADAAYDPVTDAADSERYGLLMDLIQNGTEEERLRATVELRAKLFGSKEPVHGIFDLIFDPTENIMHLKALDMSAHDHGSLSDVLVAWLAAAEAVGIDKIELDASEDPDGRMWADYGAVPDAQDWQNASKGLKAAITDGTVELTDSEKEEVLPLLSSNEPESLWALLDLGIPAVEEYLTALDLTMELDLADEVSMHKFTETVSA